MEKYIFVFAFIFSSCIPTSRDTILSISNCPLPCWNGITPNGTTTEEAIKILANTEGIGAENVHSYYQTVEINFFLSLEKPGLNKRAWGHINSDGNTVKELLLMGDLEITFDNLIAEIGEPEYVISTYYVGGTRFGAIYPNKGVLFEITSNSDFIEIETIVDSIMLFDPLMYENLLSEKKFFEYSAQEIKRIRYTWNGYGNIEQLYPPRVP